VDFYYLLMEHNVKRKLEAVPGLQGIDPTTLEMLANTDFITDRFKELARRAFDVTSIDVYDVLGLKEFPDDFIEVVKTMGAFKVDDFKPFEDLYKLYKVFLVAHESSKSAVETLLQKMYEDIERSPEVSQYLTSFCKLDEKMSTKNRGIPLRRLVAIQQCADMPDALKKPSPNSSRSQSPEKQGVGASSSGASAAPLSFLSGAPVSTVSGKVPVSAVSGGAQPYAYGLSYINPASGMLSFASLCGAPSTASVFGTPSTISASGSSAAPAYGAQTAMSARVSTSPTFGAQTDYSARGSITPTLGAQTDFSSLNGAFSSPQSTAKSSLVVPMEHVKPVEKAPVAQNDTVLPTPNKKHAGASRRKPLVNATTPRPARNNTKKDDGQKPPVKPAQTGGGRKNPAKSAQVAVTDDPKHPVKSTFKRSRSLESTSSEDDKSYNVNSVPGAGAAHGTPSLMLAQPMAETTSVSQVVDLSVIDSDPESSVGIAVRGKIDKH